MNDEELKQLRRQAEALNAGIARLAGDNPIPTFGQFSQQYLQEKLARKDLRVNTRRSFRNSVEKHLIPGFGGILIDQLTNKLWVEWIEKEQTKDVRLAKFFNCRKALIEILRKAMEAGHIQKLPTLDNPDVYEPVGRVIEDAEMLRILWKARQPFRFIFYTFWKMGNRPREILQWRWDMFNWDEPGKTWINITAKISKTDKARAIAVDPVVSRILARRRKIGNRSVFVFPARNDITRPQLTYWSAWATACEHAKVDAMPYDTRRTRITKWLADKKPVDFVARQLGTSRTMIERFYLKDDRETMESLFK